MIVFAITMQMTIRSSHQRCSVRKVVLRNFAQFRGKHLRQVLFHNKIAGREPATLRKKRLWHRCFPVNFSKFLRTPLLTEHLWWLLLNNNMEKEALKRFGIFIANFTVNVFSSFFTVGFLRIVCFYFLYSETSE